MDVVKVLFRSSEVRPSVFLTFYFRLIGIYVREYHIDIAGEQRAALTVPLEDNVQRAKLNTGAYIYMLCNDDDVIWFKNLWGNGYFDNKTENNTIVIVSNDIKLKFEDMGINPLRIFIYQRKNSNLRLLVDINDYLKKYDNTIEHQFDNLNELAKIYCNNRIYNLNFIGMFSYPEDTREGFEVIKDRYKKIINKFAKLLKNPLNMVEKEYIYTLYAMVNMKYELDYYCIKCRRPIEHMADLQEESTKLERCAMDNDMLVDSVMILVGRIYEDILMDPGKAYEYYFKSCKHFNAYVYFRKGTYWKNYKKYYDRAIMDYKKSIAYFPEYYRAWFNLAQAYLADNNYDEALNAFSKVVIILYERFKSNVLRTLEIDYLFKAYSCMAYIYHASGDDYEAIRSYMRAERVWEKIDKSEFWENLNSDIYNGRNEEKKIECTNVHEKMKKQTKEKLDITNIYLNICDLSHQIKDEDLFTEYQNKLKLEEQR